MIWRCRFASRRLLAAPPFFYTVVRFFPGCTIDDSTVFALVCVYCAKNETISIFAAWRYLQLLAGPRTTHCSVPRFTVSLCQSQYVFDVRGIILNNLQTPDRRRFESSRRSRQHGSIPAAVRTIRGTTASQHQPDIHRDILCHLVSHIDPPRRRLWARVRAETSASEQKVGSRSARARVAGGRGRRRRRICVGGDAISACAIKHGRGQRQRFVV